MLAFCLSMPRDRKLHPYFSILTILIVILSFTSCTTVTPMEALPPLSPHSMLKQLSPLIESELQQTVSTRIDGLAASHERIANVPAQFKRELAIETLKHPWHGLTILEQHGLLLAQLAEGGAPNLPALLNALEAGMDRSSERHIPIRIPPYTTRENMRTVILQTFEQAASHRDRALKKLTVDERRFLFHHAASFAEHFTPQYSTMSGQTAVQLKSNLRFTTLLSEQVAYAGLIASAQALTRLTDAQWLDAIAEAFRTAPPLQTVPPGITGEVVFAEDTTYGLIVIGGTGPNTYEMDGRFALIIDLGGDDLYRGIIGASSSEERGNAAVIDLGGNDTYLGDRLGLATGCLGVGLVIDQAGNDHYHLSEGSGGAGFAGLGILLDITGDDTYT